MTVSEIYFNSVLYNAYKEIPLGERQGLAALAKEWYKAKPLIGKKVLLNCHLTLATLIMLDLLLLAGADVTVTTTPELVVHSEPLHTIANANIKYYPSDKLPREVKFKYFDIVIDCGAGLLNDIKPKLGMVELTKTDPELYKEVDFSVINVDDSNLKSIETFGGTGDGFIRALVQNRREHLDNKIRERQRGLRQAEFEYKELKIQEESLKEQANKKLTNEESKNFKTRLRKLNEEVVEAELQVLSKMEDLLEKQAELEQLDSKIFSDNEYVIFGFGKVGNGIINALIQAGVQSNNITVIDTQSEACKRAKLYSYQAIQLKENNIDTIKKCLGKAFCIITATGKFNCISEYFRPEDMLRALKINMGTPDEWGCNFKDSIVLNKKKPFNFTLEYPTKMAYLDPIFKALMASCVELDAYSNQKGLISLPEKIDNTLFFEWQNFYPDIANSIPFWRLAKSANDLISKFYNKPKSPPSLIDELEFSDSESITSCTSTDPSLSESSTSESSDNFTLFATNVSPKKYGHAMARSLSCSDLLSPKRLSF